MSDHIPATLWARSPENYVRECIEVGIDHFVFFEGMLANRSMNPHKFLELHHKATSGDYEFMVIGEGPLSSHFMAGRDKPIGVYPNWDAIHDSVQMLEKLVANPLGENIEACQKPEGPIFGQEHVVIINNIPDLNVGRAGKQCLQMLRDLQQEYPEVTLHITDIFSFSPLINMGFKSFDMNPRIAAGKGDVFLPNGRKVNSKTEIHRHGQWVGLLGFRPIELNYPRNRCIFSLRAIQWAVEQGPTGPAFARRKSGNDGPPDRFLSDANFEHVTRGRRVLPANIVAQMGDKVECDSCSLFDNCKLARVGAVCTLPGSEMGELAKLFDTTDTTSVLKGLSRLTSLAAERAERSMLDENDFGLDPEVTKTLKLAFDFGERYAKLNDPTLRMNVNVNKNVGENQMPLSAQPVQVHRLPTPQEAAQLAQEYYSKLGFEPQQITQKMMTDFLSAMMNPPKMELTGATGDGADVIEDAEVV